MDKLLGDAEMRGKEAELDPKAGGGPAGQAWSPGESRLSQDRPLRHSRPLLLGQEALCKESDGFWNDRTSGGQAEAWVTKTPL